MNSPKSLKLLLLKGQDHGPKTGEISNWPGRAVYSPVEYAGEILKRKEFEKPGVYILKSDPKKVEYTERVYVGESGKLRDRLKDHLSKVASKPFSSFVAFYSTDSLLNKATVKYLEHRLINMAHESKTSEVANRAKSAEPFISEGDKYSMDFFLGEMRLLLPIMGFEFLNPGVVTPIAQEAPIQIKDLYRISGKLVEAFMYTWEGRFVVTKGSQVKKGVSASIGNRYVKKRNLLLAHGSMIDTGSTFILTEDVVFTSTSTASSVVLGRQTAGPREWKHTETGKTYAQTVQEQTK